MSKEDISEINIVYYINENYINIIYLLILKLVFKHIFQTYFFLLILALIELNFFLAN